MESLFKVIDKKKQVKLQASSSSQPTGATGGKSNPKSQDNNESEVNEGETQSMLLSQPSFVKEPPKKEKIPLQHTKRGKLLDTAAAFVGLPHVCSDE
ncbi:hypothetical protein LTR37_015244 [Vermiconidia calcicola]|uniref:Uncharacterized protein n=1 Tax=Vermiconidia calcicola TaxID=1690605 RepID=A0ACC3MR83_9PEZI|nr:hypothetical protein LTR37_015244 [Vermiconidia calcicola]